MRTTPKPVPEASHSRMNVFVKSGAVNTGVDVIRVFNCSKQVYASLSQLKSSLFNNDVRGATIWA